MDAHPEKIRRRRHRLRSRPPRERGGPPAMTPSGRKTAASRHCSPLRARLWPRNTRPKAPAPSRIACWPCRNIRKPRRFSASWAQIGRSILRPILEDALAAGKTALRPPVHRAGPHGVPPDHGPASACPRPLRTSWNQRQTRRSFLWTPSTSPCCPVVTCNYLGQRLGHGGGYYDRFLSQYRGGTVLLCRELLIRQEIPVEPHDYPVPWVLTERGSV